MRRLFALLAALCLGACATAPAYRTLNPSCLAAEGPKYQRDGHQDTVYIVARLAGRSSREAAELSFHAQAPDDLSGRFGAVPVSFWGSFGAWGYRHRINAVLHSLHGGDAQDVERQRERLIAAVRSDRFETWRTGFILHALGDSFSHTRADGSAYGELFGHGFDGHAPDLAGLRPGLYRAYVESLFEALDQGGNRAGLEAYLAEMDALSGAAAPAYAAAIRSRRSAGGAGPSLDCDALAAPLNIREVNDFLRNLESAL